MALPLISIFVSNDFLTDQRLQRIRLWLLQKGYPVQVVAATDSYDLQARRSDPAFRYIWLRPRKGFFRYLLLQINLFLAAWQSKATIFYAVDLDTILPLRLVAWIRSRRLIWDCHEIFTQMPELYKRPLSRWVWKRIEELAIPGLQEVITVTDGVKAYLFDTYRLQASVVHNYPVYYPLIVSIEAKFYSRRLLFQGALNEGRWLPEMILIVKCLPDFFELDILGDGPLLEELNRVIDTEGLRARVHLLGKKMPAELIPYTTNAFLGISLLDPSHGNSVASLANKNTDYIMAGLPSITMNLPEYKRINEKWPVAILVDDIQPDRIAKEIMALAGDKERYIQMVEACLQARESLHWENESLQLEKFF
jgi:glycosyltransferase involved in cell wall biosynthesis